MRPTVRFAKTTDLEQAYVESGPSDGWPVVLLHGFPYDVHAYDGVAPVLANAGARVIVPFLRGYGPTVFRSKDTLRSGQQAALGHDLLALLDALEISRAILAGYDWGGRAACIVAALRPERVTGLVSANGYNIQNIPGSVRPAEPEAEHRHWYQYYLHGERGRLGLAENTDRFCRLLWRLWSPTWPFDDDTFSRTAESFRNAAFVDVVTHSYRHRYGLVAGDPRFQAWEDALASSPVITPPTIVLDGEVDGVSPPKPPDPARFAALAAYRVLPNAGHNVPQEAPETFAAAVLKLHAASASTAVG